MTATAETLITAEALRVAQEYVDYRIAEGLSPIQILADLAIDLPRHAERVETMVRTIALHWQAEIAPASRAVDAQERATAADRRKLAYAQKKAPAPIAPARSRVIGGKVVRNAPATLPAKCVKDIRSPARRGETITA